MDAGSISDITKNFVSGSIGELAAESSAPAVGSDTIDFVATLPKVALQLTSAFLRTLGL